MISPNRIIPILFILLIAGTGSSSAQFFDISSGGLPTITGANGGSVSGSSSTNTNLSVTINFGEVSPSNTNNIVKVTVPVGIRSLAAYRVTATITGGTNANAQAVQRADIGFGIENLRRTGFFSLNCRVNSHTIYSPFNNDPADNVSILPNGRVSYPGTLNNISGSTTVLSGPALSWLLGARFSGNEWIFDAIFTITPQFFAPGTTSATITFTISAGPSASC
ncbi:MAG: hypothetical protein AB7J13_06615 [Pyrinomonadaceae bacterium]